MARSTSELMNTLLIHLCIKSERVRCLNATTGDEVWTMTGWAYPETFATADGVLIYWNNYDAQIYAIGKGPSSTTVTASPKVSALGSSVLIEGTVIDISAGTQQNEQAARFPNGVPAVSDASPSTVDGICLHAKRQTYQHYRC